MFAVMLNDLIQFSMDSSPGILFVSVLLMIFSFSCTKSTTSNNSNAANIYMVGSNGKNPVLWENGELHILSPSGGYATQVQVYDNAIYIGGVSGQSTSAGFNPGGPGGYNVYWINGIQNNISSSLNPGRTSFAISGKNFYYPDGYNLYENDSILFLPGKSDGSIASVLVSGTDIYVAGSDSVGDAVYWKNQAIHVVEQGYYPTHNSGSDPSVYCFFLSGSDVYLGGTDVADLATYWKNGVATPIYGGAGYLTAINSLFVSGADLQGLVSNCLDSRY
jgi:hypothetical protein